MGMDNQKFTMTKKDYTLIAGAICKANNTWSKEAGLAKQAIKDLTITLAIELEHDNRLFDCAKFYKVCEI
jgi:hypothetical protein